MSISLYTEKHDCRTIHLSPILLIGRKGRSASQESMDEFVFRTEFDLQSKVR